MVPVRVLLTPRWRAWPARPARACRPPRRPARPTRRWPLLHKAVAMGYRNPNAYRTEDALDPIRRRDDFRLLILDLDMPAEPFARGD